MDFYSKLCFFLSEIGSINNIVEPSSRTSQEILDGWQNQEDGFAYRTFFFHKNLRISKITEQARAPELDGKFYMAAKIRDMNLGWHYNDFTHISKLAWEIMQ